MMTVSRFLDDQGYEQLQFAFMGAGLFTGWRTALIGEAFYTTTGGEQPFLDKQTITSQ